MTLQHNIIVLTLLSQSFLSVSMESPALTLAIQEMRAYGTNIQNKNITFAQETNSSFERLKPAKKQNICNQNAITIEQPQRFKESIQREEIIDINFFQEDTQTATAIKPFDPTSHFSTPETLALFYLFSAQVADNREDYIAYGLKYIELQENMLEQKTQIRRDTPLKELEALKKKQKRKSINAFKQSSDEMEQSSDEMEMQLDPATRCLNELQDKVHNKHKSESNKNYCDWLKEQQKKLHDLFDNTTNHYSSYGHHCPPYISHGVETESFYLLTALSSDNERDYMFYGHAYVDYGKKLLKKQNESVMNELHKKIQNREQLQQNTQKHKSEQSTKSNSNQESPIIQLSDEPENPHPCAIAVVTAGISWGIVSLVQIISGK
jgi:hypothetical protein